MVSIIIRDINIVKNTVLEPIFHKDSISGITFAIIFWQRIESNAFWTEENHRSVILVINPPFIWKSYGGLNHHQRKQYSKNTVFELVLRKDSIYGLNFAIIIWKSIESTLFWTEENHRYVILVLYPPFIWSSCGGLNHHQIHQYCQEYCLWTSVV